MISRHRLPPTSRPMTKRRTLALYSLLNGCNRRARRNAARAIPLIMLFMLNACSSVPATYARVEPACLLTIQRPGEFQCVTHSVGCMNSDALMRSTTGDIPVCRIPDAWH